MRREETRRLEQAKDRLFGLLRDRQRDRAQLLASLQRQQVCPRRRAESNCLIRHWVSPFLGSEREPRSIFKAADIVLPAGSSVQAALLSGIGKQNVNVGKIRERESKRRA